MLHKYVTKENNTMENKNEQILQLLNEGKSYSEIQSLLKVSPSKIAQIKREATLQNTISSSDSSSDSTIEDSTTEALSSKSYDLIRNNNDPALLLELRKMELAHEEKLIKLKMEEKSRDREFESEKRTLSNSQYQEDIMQLKNKIKKLEDELTKKSNMENDVEEDDSLYSGEENEDENYPLSEDLSSEFQDFISAFLELKDTTLDKEDIKFQLDQIEDFLIDIESAYDEEGMDFDESDKKEVLEEAKTDLEKLISEIDNSFFSTTARYSFSDEWEARLEDLLL